MPSNTSWNFEDTLQAQQDCHFNIPEHDFDVKSKTIIDIANKGQLNILLPSFVMICGLLVVGLPGNILAFLIYQKKLKHTIARNFLLVMCICDTCNCAIVMPIELDIMRNFFDYDTQWLCKGFRLFAYSINNVSSLTLLAIAVERYRIICNPWKPKFSSKLSKRICCLNVVVAILTSIPMAFIYGTQTIPLGMISQDQSSHVDVNFSVFMHDCNISYDILQRTEQIPIVVQGKSCLMDDNVIGSTFPMYVVAIYIASIILVFLTLIFLYGHVIRQLSRRRKESMCVQNSESLQGASCKRVQRVTVMTIVLTIAFELCYLPCLTAVCIRLAHPNYYNTLSASGRMMFNICLKSYLLNSTVNPFIYCFCNRDFRMGLFKLFRSIKIAIIPSKPEVVDVTSTKTFNDTAFEAKL